MWCGFEIALALPSITPLQSQRIMISHFFIDRPIFATVLSILILIVGGVALLGLPIAQYPDVAPPTVQVTATYPGANATTVAETVATPIELEINGVERMLYMSSKCTNDGQMMLDVTFELGTNLDTAQVLVQNRVAVAEAKLPEEVKRIGVTTKKEIAEHSALRQPDFAGQTLQPALPQQLRDAQREGRLGPHQRRGGRVLPGAAGLQHADLAGPQQARRQGHGRDRCDPRHQRAKRAGGGGPDRATAGHGQCRRAVSVARQCSRAARPIPSSLQRSSLRPARQASWFIFGTWSATGRGQERQTR